MVENQGGEGFAFPGKAGQVREQAVNGRSEGTRQARNLLQSRAIRLAVRAPKGKCPKSPDCLS